MGMELRYEIFQPALQETPIIHVLICRIRQLVGNFQNIVDDFKVKRHVRNSDSFAEKKRSLPWHYQQMTCNHV